MFAWRTIDDMLHLFGMLVVTVSAVVFIQESFANFEWYFVGKKSFVTS